MRNRTVLTAAVFAATLGAIPASAQNDDVCLRLNDVYNTRVHDSSTLVATDRQRNEYTLNMSGTCVGLTTDAQPLIFDTVSEFSCMKHGDRVSYSMPGEPLDIQLYGGSGQTTCFIDTIVEGAPAG
jgi:hypothetical protein